MCLKAYNYHAVNSNISSHNDYLFILVKNIVLNLYSNGIELEFIVPGEDNHDVIKLCNKCMVFHNAITYSSI